MTVDFLTWLSGVDPSAVINALGLGSLAILFATDRIKTRGQVMRELAERDKNHDKVVAALEKSQAATLAALMTNHTDQITGRDERILELKQSLARLEDARNVERERANAATGMLGKAVDAVEVSNHLLESLGTATKKGRA